MPVANPAKLLTVRGALSGNSFIVISPREVTITADEARLGAGVAVGC